MLTEVLPPSSAPVAVEEVKAYLRLDGAGEDAILAGFIRTATALAEAFTGRTLIGREMSEAIGVGPGWQQLRAMPVAAISGVETAGGPLAAGAYEIDIDLTGIGWIRVNDAGPARQASVRYTAGLGSDWNAVPEPIRQGIVRLVAHLHAYRDAPDVPGLPAAVAALWRPWRRMRLA